MELALRPRQTFRELRKRPALAICKDKIADFVPIDLTERLRAHKSSLRESLETLVVNSSAPRPARMHALWALIGLGELPEEFHLRVLNARDAAILSEVSFVTRPLA